MSNSFTFGTSTTATPTFGTANITFGAPSNQIQPQTTGFSFGGTPGAVPSTTPSLFGTPAAVTASTAPLFGGISSTQAPATGFSLGSTVAASTAASGLSFGNLAASKAPTLNFGAPAPATTTTATLSFGLGAAPTATTSAPSLGLSFGAPAASATTTTPSFGAPASNAAPPSFGFGTTGGTQVAAATTASGGLNFSFGAPAGATTTTTSTGVFGLGGTTTTTASLNPPTTSAPVGLGGVATAIQGKTTAVVAQKEVPPKDQPLPNEILQTVEAFKEMVKQQKAHSSDIARCSVRDFRRVEQEIDQLSNQINEVEKELQKNRQLAEKLKYDTAKTVQNVEMAQRTHDTPPGLQYENTAPLKFFLNLADQFERDMQNLKMQIEAADKYVKNHKNPDALTPQDLAMGMRRLHETFVALAGRLQSVHSQVESQKETYLQIRKHLLQDTSNPFDKLTKAPEFQVSNFLNAFHSPPKVATGPTPFNNLSFGSMSGGMQQHTSPQPPAYPGALPTQGSGFGTPGFGGGAPSNTSLFGSTTFGQSSTINANNSFQLQKPPTGNKRGKM